MAARKAEIHIPDVATLATVMSKRCTQIKVAPSALPRRAGVNNNMSLLEFVKGNRPNTSITVIFKLLDGLGLDVYVKPREGSNRQDKILTDLRSQVAQRLEESKAVFSEQVPAA